MKPNTSLCATSLLPLAPIAFLQSTLDTPWFILIPFNIPSLKNSFRSKWKEALGKASFQAVFPLELFLELRQRKRLLTPSAASMDDSLFRHCFYFSNALALLAGALVLIPNVYVFFIGRMVQGSVVGMMSGILPIMIK